MNGGVWGTTDGGTHWEPLTEDQASLAIGSLAISPFDRNGDPVDSSTSIEELVLLVGTGQFSNSNDGGTATGLYFSSDGGKT